MSNSTLTPPITSLHMRFIYSQLNNLLFDKADRYSRGRCWSRKHTRSAARLTRFIFLLFLCSCTTHKSSFVATDNYVEQATLFLERAPSGASFLTSPTVRINSDGAQFGTSRCVRMNNYWCLKNTPLWHGTLGQDPDKHAIFSDARFGARAFIRTMRRYVYGCGLNNLEDILCKYAPDYDCIGSAKTALSACKKNNCREYAQYVAHRLGVNSSDPLELFDDSGNATLLVAELGKSIVKMETGSFTANDKLLLLGIKLEADTSIHDGKNTLSKCP